MHGRKGSPTEVKLNVYDLSPVNEFGHPIGLGVFHSGLEVDGREYTFAGGGGIFDHDPRKAPGARFRESVSMGSFSGGSSVLRGAIDSLREDFGPDRYNVLTRNCNTFSSALCEELVGRPIPGYVNRLAWMGSWFSCLMPPSMLGDAPVNEGSSSYSAGYSMLAPPGRRSGPAPIRGGTNSAAFQGSGMSLTGSGSGGGSTATASSAGGSGAGRESELSDRRERMRMAALRRAEAAAAAAAASGNKNASISGRA
ncbi:unnamed protein product [Pylaiella littoralis]